MNRLSHCLPRSYCRCLALMRSWNDSCRREHDEILWRHHRSIVRRRRYTPCTWPGPSNIAPTLIEPLAAFAVSSRGWCEPLLCLRCLLGLDGVVMASCTIRTERFQKGAISNLGRASSCFVNVFR